MTWRRRGAWARGQCENVWREREEGVAEERRDLGEGEDVWGKGGGCGLAVARYVKRVAAKKVAATRFRYKRYC